MEIEGGVFDPARGDDLLAASDRARMGGLLVQPGTQDSSEQIPPPSIDPCLRKHDPATATAQHSVAGHSEIYLGATLEGAIVQHGAS